MPHVLEDAGVEQAQEQSVEDWQQVEQQQQKHRRQQKQVALQCFGAQPTSARSRGRVRQRAEAEILGSLADGHLRPIVERTTTAARHDKGKGLMRFQQSNVYTHVATAWSFVKRR